MNGTITKNNADKCLEISDTPKLRVTDEQAKSIIFKVSKCENAADFQKLDSKSRDEFIAILKQKGLSIRQISRLTGANYYIIQKI